MKFDAIFFDVDGTLVENSGLMPKSVQKAFARLGMQIEIVPWIGSGKVDYQIINLFLDKFPEISEEEKPVLAEKLSELEIEEVRAALAARGLKANPGVPELIEKLKANHISFGLLTGNMQAIVKPKLEAAGLCFEDFKYGGFGDHSPMRRVTAQRALESAAAFLGKDPQSLRCLVIGDTPNDIDCARGIGAEVLAVAAGEIPSDTLKQCAPDYLLENFEDIDAFFRILE